MSDLSGDTEMEIMDRNLLKEFSNYIKKEISKINILEMYDILMKEHMLDMTQYNFLVELSYYYSLVNRREKYICLMKTFYDQSRIQSIELCLIEYLYSLSIIYEMLNKSSFCSDIYI